jgi:hypothetical protein
MFPLGWVIWQNLLYSFSPYGHSSCVCDLFSPTLICIFLLILFLHLVLGLIYLTCSFFMLLHEFCCPCVAHTHITAHPVICSDMIGNIITGMKMCLCLFTFLAVLSTVWQCIIFYITIITMGITICTVVDTLASYSWVQISACYSDWGFTWLSQSLQADSGIWPQISPQLIPSTSFSFPAHYSLMIIQYNLIQVVDSITNKS